MQLWLVRHAIAVARIPDGLEDADRPLTSKGARQFKRLAAWLAARQSPPQHILTSPLVRTLETAEILRKAFDLGKKRMTPVEFAAPGMDVRRLLKALREEEAKRVALVGHEPDLSHACRQLISGGNVAFEKGAVACLDFEETAALKCGSLRWLANPELACRTR